MNAFARMALDWGGLVLHGVKLRTEPEALCRNLAVTGAVDSCVKDSPRGQGQPRPPGQPLSRNYMERGGGSPRGQPLSHNYMEGGVAAPGARGLPPGPALKS